MAEVRDYSKVSWNELAYEWENEVRRLREKFNVEVKPKNNVGFCGFRSLMNKDASKQCRATTKIPSDEVCRTCSFFKTYEEVKRLNEEIEKCDYSREGEK